MVGYDYNGDLIEVLFDVFGTLLFVVDDFMELWEVVILCVCLLVWFELCEIVEVMLVFIVGEVNGENMIDVVFVAVMRVRVLINEYGVDFVSLVVFCECYDGGLV